MAADSGPPRRRASNVDAGSRAVPAAARASACRRERTARTRPRRTHAGSAGLGGSGNVGQDLGRHLEVEVLPARVAHDESVAWVEHEVDLEAAAAERLRLEVALFTRLSKTPAAPATPTPVHAAHPHVHVPGSTTVTSRNPRRGTTSTTSFAECR